ncbi:MAG: protein kinase [bacterium]
MTQEPLIGSLIAGRFELRERIEERHTGALYLSHHTELGSSLSVEVVTRGGADGPEIADGFREEARKIAGLVHPGVAALVDFGRTTAGDWFLVSEHVHGQSLEALLARSGTDPIPLPDALSVLEQLARALDRAHTADLTHGDLKPRNILLGTAKPGSHVVRTVGFGRTRLLQRIVPVGLTRKEPLLDAPVYTSPELLAGAPVGAPADLYSFGILAFVLCTGRPPFECATAALYRVAHCDSAPPRPSASRPDFAGPLPDGVEELILACLGKQPEARPVARELLHPLREARRRASREALQKTRESAPLDRWVRLRKQAETTAKYVQYVRLGTEPIQAGLAGLAQHDLALASMDLEFERLGDHYDDTARQGRDREAQLRRAVLDLREEQDRLVEQGAGDQHGAQDLRFQITELERSLRDVEAKRSEALAAVATELVQQRQALDAFAAALEPRVRKLVDAIRDRRPGVGDPSLVDQIDGVLQQLSELESEQ